MVQQSDSDVVGVTLDRIMLALLLLAAMTAEKTEVQSITIETMKETERQLDRERETERNTERNQKKKKTQKNRDEKF